MNECFVKDLISVNFYTFKPKGIPKKSIANCNARYTNLIDLSNPQQRRFSFFSMNPMGDILNQDDRLISFLVVPRVLLVSSLENES
jgi:hypothetical protein